MTFDVRDMCASLGIEAVQLPTGEWIYPWLHPKARFCFFLYADILGFSNVLAGDVTKAATMLRALRGIARKLCRARPAGGGNTARFGYQLAMDTVVFYIKNVRNVKIAIAYEDFLRRCGILYWAALAKHEVMLRGAISGARDYVAAPEVFVAPTLLRCYDIEKMQNWTAIGVDVDNITLAAGPMGLSDNIVAPNYLVPIKGNPIGVGYLLNPTMPLVRKASGTRVSVATVIERLKSNAANDRIPKAAKLKIQNTVKYLQWGESMQTGGW